MFQQNLITTNCDPSQLLIDEYFRPLLFEAVGFSTVLLEEDLNALPHPY